MTELLQWANLKISRRRFLRRALGGTFAVMAGATVRAPIAFAQEYCQYPCVGPNGSGNCNTYVPGTCSGSSCTSVYGVTCDYTSLFCGTGSACWTYGSHVCCDCHCGDVNGDTWYCYCNT